MQPTEFGATHWGRAWLRTIERSGRAPNPHLPKARTLARNQHVTILIEAQTITGTVTDGASAAHVHLTVPAWNKSQNTAAAPLFLRARKAHAGAVIGDLPDSLADDLNALSVPVAEPLETLSATCTCRARTRPCVHILATIYALILRVDEQPELAVQLRATAAQLTEPTRSGWIPLLQLAPANYYAVDGTPLHSLR